MHRLIAALPQSLFTASLQLRMLLAGAVVTLLWLLTWWAL